MGLLDWFRRRRNDEPDIIPLPSLRPPEPVFSCDSVRVDEQGLTASLTGGPALRLEFHDLQRVAIRTTDEGPFAEDVFWILTAEKQVCIIPQGAEGQVELFDQLLKLPGFDCQAMVVAMSSTENAEFECWKRSTSAM